MLNSPRKYKFKKRQRRGSKALKSVDKSRHLIFGDYGVKAAVTGILNARQIEAGRQVLSKYIKKQGAVWTRAFPHFPVTSKPSEVRMGKGKGLVSFWAVKIKKGEIIYEISGPKSIVKEAVLKCQKKLPIFSTFI